MFISLSAARHNSSSLSVWWPDRGNTQEFDSSVIESGDNLGLGVMQLRIGCLSTVWFSHRGFFFVFCLEGTRRRGLVIKMIELRVIQCYWTNIYTHSRLSLPTNIKTGSVRSQSINSKWPNSIQWAAVESCIKKANKFNLYWNSFVKLQFTRSEMNFSTLLQESVLSIEQIKAAQNQT